MEGQACLGVIRPSGNNAHLALGSGRFVSNADVFGIPTEFKGGLQLNKGQVVLRQAPALLGQRVGQDLKEGADLRLF